MNGRLRNLLIALYCCCSGGVGLSAQTATHTSVPGLQPPPLHISRISWRIPTTSILPANNITGIRPAAQPQAWHFQDLALFCKLEVKMERAFRLPVRIRVGDVSYVDWLEGKRRSAY